MNKQPKLIDADKVVEWARKRDKSGLRVSAIFIMEALEMGEFDPTPVPTIKPKDWVYHTKFKAKGQVKRISESGKRAYVIWVNGAAPSFVDLKSLEVSHD